MDELYPAGPQGVPADLVRPTTAYKQRAWFAMASLILFVAIYLALAGWFVWTAYRMLDEALYGGPDAFMQAVVGSCAAFLALFMSKALFFVQRGGAPDALEVTADEQPRLFAFLYRLADEAGAPRPRRVYLSARVNAAVFYDLTIFNLIFPSRKNLEIGLALVNVLTVSEIKAVLAHEFGHFAQRSMAIGSWVYIAQRIAAQVISKRDALDKLLNFISNFDLRIAWVGWLLSLVVWSIRSLMDTLLRLVVLAQRALSRQMEFQADLMAVSLTGSDELVHALHKLQAADEAWSRGLNFANNEAQQGRLPHDLFAVQTRIIEKLAHILDDDEYGQVPRATTDRPEAFRVFKTGFAQPPQMWSTHPANADREENAKRRYLPAPHDNRSAWLLFDDVDSLKTKVVACITNEAKAEPVSAEQTFKALDERYALAQYDPRYRGAYLGRSLTRHVKTPAELYDAVLGEDDVHRALATLYPQQLAHDLARLRELEEERIALQALQDRIYQPTGGRLVYRGREISRRDLPAAIREVAQEEEQTRQTILAHDRRCRSAHLAAAARLGGGWQQYLAGLMATLHYAEHTLADLLDAQGLLNNVVAVVTADGKVSASELKRLIATANVLHGVLARIYQEQATVRLDSILLERLGVSAWPEMLEEFKLPPASKENINNWMGVIEGWVGAASGALSALYSAALEQLLLTEERIEQHVRAQSAPDPAPEPSAVPSDYPYFVSGQERVRQKRLGLWDRFQTADGIFGTLARLLVAGVIVGAVLGFGSVIKTNATLSVYNGLGRAVQVDVGGTHLALAPFSARQIDIGAAGEITLESRSSDNRVIEHFTRRLSGHAAHYVYNIAGASPLVLWTATYGSARERSPQYLGAPRWATTEADVYFADPPRSVKTQSGGAIRTVLDSPGDRPPEELLKLVAFEAERKQVIAAHAAWDEINATNARRWRELAAAH